MKIVQIYNHLNGLDFLKTQKLVLWNEIQNSIKNVDADKAFDKISNKITMTEKILYSSSKLSELFKKEFSKNSWRENRTFYFVSGDLQTSRETVHIRDKAIQKRTIIQKGFSAFCTSNQIDFLKDRIALGVHFGKYFAVQYDLHVRYPFFYSRGDIDVGIEIIPMHSLMSHMPKGVAWYENELTNIVREGRSNPAVPIVLIGIEPEGSMRLR